MFPVWTNASGQLGISTGTGSQLEVTELASGPQVGKLSISNHGSKPALLVEGELLEGGHQHRVCAADVILGVGERREVETFCIEQGRWGGSSSHSRTARRAPLSVRAELHTPAKGNRQGRIWERISRHQGVSGSSPTGSLVELLNASRNRTIPQQFRLPLPLEGQRGVILGLEGEALMIEVFGTHSLFLRHYGQLADAVAMDLQLFATVPEAATPAQEVRQLAATLGDLRIAPFGDNVFTVRDHETLKSESFSAQNGCQTVTGIRVAIRNRTPQFAHLSVWNMKHPRMASI
ncbi:ARPP-1 family domain-containing protein [Arthrobacter bambusae]|uniref:ARPP-1 family domain-containing protein n=1 Tax=Arthrobacter bambusae TaxID=1338426 RepID=UPI0035226902